MRIMKLTMAAVVLGLLSAGTVNAQFQYQPAMAQPVAYNYGMYPSQPSMSPSDSSVLSDYDYGSCSALCGATCSPYGPCAPRKLLPCGIAGVNIGGWVSAGAYANAHGDPLVPTLGTNNVNDSFVFNQVWMYAEKALDTRCGWDWGGRVDYVFGADGPDTQAFGDEGARQPWDTGWDSARDYGSAIPQAYGELGYGNLSVKVGHFFTIIGYEVIPAPDNFFYSHSYTMYYAEPFTHSGALATYDAGRFLTLYGGWTAGWDTGFSNDLNASTFLGGATLSFGDCLSVTYACTAGDFGDGQGDIYMHSIVGDVEITDRLTYVIQHDLGVQSNGGGEQQWGGINQYVLYSINPCWDAGVRFEWFNDRDGSRVSAGSQGDFYELTAGLNWKPCSNIIFRPELRYDWFNGTGALPYNQGQNGDMLAGGFDLILTF